jgi:serine protease Do
VNGGDVDPEHLGRSRLVPAVTRHDPGDVRRLLAAWASVVLASAPGTAPDSANLPAAQVPSSTASTQASPALYCTGEYADDFAALSREAREFERQQPPYTYCIRTTAIYECPSYGADGSLRRARQRVVAHGTGFGYRQQSGETLVVTNQHVAEWPAVTDADHSVEGVPAGCKRVSDSLRIVESERDAYERDDIPLTRIVADPQLDIAVLRAKAALPVVPWKIGHSASLRERNVVDVRGFPLGVLRANNVGKVVSAYDHDDQRDWDHDDFVIDALLSHGNSGSPVFAISCRTGEFELVGVYHARYDSSSALNVVIGIDQLRDLLTTMQRPRRAQADGGTSALDAAARDRVWSHAQATGGSFFPFGTAAAAVHARPDGALVFELKGHDFPLQTSPVLVIEDVPPRSPSSFGAVGRIWAGNRQGIREVDRGGIDAETLALTAKILDALRKDSLLAVAYRSAVRQGLGTRERFQQVARLERAARRSASSQQDLEQSAPDLAERLCPDSSDVTGTLADALAVPPASASPGGLSPEAAPAAPAWLPVIAGAPPSVGGSILLVTGSGPRAEALP